MRSGDCARAYALFLCVREDPELLSVAWVGEVGAWACMLRAAYAHACRRLTIGRAVGRGDKQKGTNLNMVVVNRNRGEARPAGSNDMLKLCRNVYSGDDGIGRV